MCVTFAVRGRVLKNALETHEVLRTVEEKKNAILMIFERKKLKTQLYLKCRRVNYDSSVGIEYDEHRK